MSETEKPIDVSLDISCRKFKSRAGSGRPTAGGAAHIQPPSASPKPTAARRAMFAGILRNTERD